MSQHDEMVNKWTRSDFEEQLKQSKEIIVTDPVTGGKKGQKLQRFSLVPRDFLWALATHYGIGARKYADRNWEKGYAWGLTVDAAERHYNKFLDAAAKGDEAGKYDNHTPGCAAGCTEHTESHHLIAAIWHLIALYVFDVRKIGTNDLGVTNVRTGTAQTSNKLDGPLSPAGTGNSGTVTPRPASFWGQAPPYVGRTRE